MSFSPSSQILASGGEDKKICLWAATTGALQHKFAGQARRVGLAPTVLRLYNPRLAPQAQVDIDVESEDLILLKDGLVCSTTVYIQGAQHVLQVPKGVACELCVRQKRGKNSVPLLWLTLG